MKTLRIAALALTALFATTTLASAQMLCAPLLMITAAIKWQNEKRELTEKEAFWCGVINDDAGAKKAADAKKKKVARREKKPGQ